MITMHVASELVRVVMSDGIELTGTAVHPVWSLDRRDWVPLGELIEVERSRMSRRGMLHRFKAAEVLPIRILYPSLPSSTIR